MPVNFRQRLSYHQAKITIIVALVLGLSLSLVQIFYDLAREKEEVSTTVRQVVEMFRESATDAVYNIDETEAQSVVNGLFKYSHILQVSVTDEVNIVLAHKSRAAEEGPFDWLAQFIFEDQDKYQVLLKQQDLDKVLGTLQITTDNYLILQNFVQRAGLLLLNDLLKNIVLSGILLLVFYYTLTQPLLVMARQVAAVDPSQPNKHLIDIPLRHRNNELGLLAQMSNRLLEGFEESLSQRLAVENELAKHRDQLEQLVVERTSELEHSLMKVEEANKNILDSLQYAKIIQSSLLPKQETLNSQLPHQFVIWQPRDIVGGDLYFMDTSEAGTILAVIDCTGHGVPGAFMTMLVVSALQRIIHDEGIHTPAAILEQLNRLVKMMLQQDQEDTLSNDGLDGAICLINTEKTQLLYAGACLPLHYIHQEQLHVVKADRHSIGYKNSKLDFNFTNHQVELKLGMSFYLYSDGLVEQLGGKKEISLGNRRLRSWLLSNHELSFPEQKKKLLQAFNEYRGNLDVQDDITMLGFRVY